MSLFKKIDLFGRGFVFEEEGQSQYKTKVGGIFTFLLIILIVIMSILLGKEIIIKEKPFVMLSQEIYQSIDDSTVNMKDFPLFFEFNTLERGSKIDYTQIIMPMIVKLDTKSDMNMSMSVHNDVLVNCNTSIFTTYTDYASSSYNYMTNNDYLIKCLNLNIDLSVKNNEGSSDSMSFFISFMKCNKQYNPYCPDNINDIISQTILTIYYINPLFNSFNLNNPLIFYPSVIQHQLSPSLFKNVKVNFINNIIQTDYGLILEDYQSFSYPSIHDIINDINQSNQDEIFRITFNGTNFFKKTKRSYMKIQELLAKIGGLFNGIYLIIYLFLESYIEFKYYVKVFTSLVVDGFISDSKGNIINSTSIKHKICTNNIVENEEDNVNKARRDEEGNVNKAVLNNNFIVSSHHNTTIDNSGFKMIINKDLSFIKCILSKVFPCFYMKERKIYEEIIGFAKKKTSFYFYLDSIEEIKLLKLERRKNSERNINQS